MHKIMVMQSGAFTLKNLTLPPPNLLQILQEVKEAKEQGVPPPFYSTDATMADGVMDFLFASQVSA